MAALDEERDAQAGVAVSIVFDDSGSMDDNHKLIMAKQAFHAWLERAPDNDRFGLTAINAGPLVKLARNDKKQVLAAVDRLHAGGGTPLADTIAAVGKIIRQRRASATPYERQVMVILTDGEDTSDRGIAGVATGDPPSARGRGGGHRVRLPGRGRLHEAAAPRISSHPKTGKTSPRD